MHLRGGFYVETRKWLNIEYKLKEFLSEGQLHLFPLSEKLNLENIYLKIFTDIQYYLDSLVVYSLC